MPLPATTAKLRTCLWFDKDGLDAAQFYVSLLANSVIERVYQQDPAKPPLVVEFTLCGAPYMVLNGGPYFSFNEAVSISVLTADQAETDQLWAALTADGGSESRCGWLKDRYGLSWQIVPHAMVEMINSSDSAAAGRTMQAMMTMTKIDIAELEHAFHG